VDNAAALVLSGGEMGRIGFFCVAASAALAWPMLGRAQIQVFGPCAQVDRPIASLSFDNAQHRAWYLRFWTGSCAGVRGFCLSGSPNWNATVAYVTAHAQPAEREALVVKTCRLGEKIGFEWARDRKVHRITIHDLADLGELLRRSHDMDVAVDRASQKVAVLMDAKRASSP
jgi:hypothetical protein